MHPYWIDLLTGFETFIWLTHVLYKRMLYLDGLCRQICQALFESVILISYKLTNTLQLQLVYHQANWQYWYRKRCSLNYIITYKRNKRTWHGAKFMKGTLRCMYRITGHTRSDHHSRYLGTRHMMYVANIWFCMYIWHWRVY